MFNRDLKGDKIEIVKQTQIEKKRELVATLKPKKNHILFEFDLVNKEVRRAEFKDCKDLSFVDAMEKLSKRKKEVDGKKGCIYISAMNEKNAWKKFNKLNK